MDSGVDYFSYKFTPQLHCTYHLFNSKYTHADEQRIKINLHETLCSHQLSRMMERLIVNSDGQEWTRNNAETYPLLILGMPEQTVGRKGGVIKNWKSDAACNFVEIRESFRVFNLVQMCVQNDNVTEGGSCSRELSRSLKQRNLFALKII